MNMSDYLRQVKGTEVSQPKAPQSLPKSRKTPAQSVAYDGSSARQTLEGLYGAPKPSVPSSQMQLLGQQEDQDSQEAYVSYQRFMKYLQMGQAAQGQQVSSGDQIQAQTNYQGQLGDIKSKYAGLKTTALETEQERLRTDKATADKATADAKIIADQQLETERNTWVSLIQNRVESALANYNVDEETGEYSYEDWDKVWKLYESAKDKMGESQREMMEFYLQSIPHKELAAAPTSATEEIPENETYVQRIAREAFTRQQNTGINGKTSYGGGGGGSRGR